MIKTNYLSLLVLISAGLVIATNNSSLKVENQTRNDVYTAPSPPSITPIPKIKLKIPPQQKILVNPYHIFQTFNNCGPASLSMALSYYKISEDQQVLGKYLRPYQNPQGDNDDKSVTLEELADMAKNYKLIPYHRPNGTIDTLKLFVTYDIPVITRTLTKVNEDIGHYRVVKGFDDDTNDIIQDDSLQGKNLRYSYANFNALWKAYNYEYLVLVPSDKQEFAEAILGEDLDLITAWRKAAENSQQELITNPDDIYLRFNLSVALYNIGDHQKSVKEFEKVEHLLPFRTLWYQIEPILAYYELGNYQRVFEITDNILNNQNRAFSELYLIRGKIYLKQENITAAREEFENAYFYNVNLQEAKDALDSL